jgi:hypothetical protein
MAEKPQPEKSDEDSDRDSPSYWIKTFQGTPMSIVVPPYIRFLQGALVLQKALNLLLNVQTVALDGNPQLSAAFEALEQSKHTKRLGLTYETFFASHLTINLVSEVEHFFASAVSAALRMYPEKMGAHTFKLIEIISATSRDELVDRAARAVLNDMMYEKPHDYIKRLGEVLSIDVKGLETSWPDFVELKARRDLGVHNNWIVNEIYLRKLREAKIDNSHRIGEQVIPDFGYMSQAMDACHQLIETMANLLGEKWISVSEEE